MNDNLTRIVLQVVLPAGGEAPMNTGSKATEEEIFHEEVRIRRDELAELTMEESQ